MEHIGNIKAKVPVERDKIPFRRVNLTKDGEVRRHTLASKLIQEPAYLPVAEQVGIKWKIRQAPLSRSRHFIYFFELSFSKTFFSFRPQKYILRADFFHGMLYNIQGFFQHPFI
jgi:hypothetical protein